MIDYNNISIVSYTFHLKCRCYLCYVYGVTVTTISFAICVIGMSHKGVSSNLVVDVRT